MKGRYHLGGISVEERIILKYMLSKWGVMMCTGYI
jgi:hypothetical protein